MAKGSETGRAAAPPIDIVETDALKAPASAAAPPGVTDIFSIAEKPAEIHEPHNEMAADPGSKSPVAISESAKPFTGYLDGPDAKWRIIGWARSICLDADRLDVRLVEGDIEIATARAERFRGDLLSAGIGDGCYGFVLPLQAKVFNGQRHKFAVHVIDVPGDDLIDTLDIVLPARAPAALESQDLADQTARKLVQISLHRERTKPNSDIHGYARKLTQTLKDIVNTYDYATALGLLYVHVLRRRIDEGGLQSRIHRLAVDPDAFSEIVYEILNSDETQARYQGTPDAGFPNLAPLAAWASLRATA